VVAPQPTPGCETALKRQAIDRPSLARHADKAFASASTPRSTFSAIRRDGPAGDRGYTAMRPSPSKTALGSHAKVQVDCIVLDHNFACRASACASYHRHVTSTIPIIQRHIVSFMSVVRNIARALRTKEARTEHHPDRFLRRDALRKFLLHKRKTWPSRCAVPRCRPRLHVQRSPCFAPASGTGYNAFHFL
jgi:hypothetical protein